MSEHEAARSKTVQRTKPANLAPASNPRSSGPGLFCEILEGRPRGPGLAEISISTKGHPTIAVGMTGILQGVPGTVTVSQVRRGVAMARLEGKGVEKLRYFTLIAILDPSSGVEEVNGSIAPADVEAARRRMSPTGGGSR